MSATSDQGRLEAFMGALVNDWKGCFASVMVILGDRLDLFRSLAEIGPATSEQLAARAGCDERYVREWSNGMVAAEYVRFHADTSQYSLSPEATLVFADESTPMGLAGAYENLGGLLRELDSLTDAFRDGGGIALEQYGEDVFRGMSRGSASWHDHLLVQGWIPLVPQLAERLAAGMRVLDVGCGQGRALIRLASEFPASTFVGVDRHGPNLTAARVAAEDAGVADRIRFVEQDATTGVAGRFDLVTAFDVVHDSADPAALLAEMRRALEDDGICLLLEINCEPTVEGNVGPFGTVRYGISLMYCLTTSLAAGGAGLGTCGMPEPVVRQMAADAGFRNVERPSLENPFNVLYVLRP